MSENTFGEIDNLEIEALSDEALELVAGGKSSDGPKCCSCENCSTIVPVPVGPIGPVSPIDDDVIIRQA